MSYAVAVRSSFSDPYLRIAVTGGTEKGGAAVYQKKNAHLRFGLPKAEEQTGEDKQREARCRTALNLYSALESMPSKSRVLESSPYQHLPRVWRDRQTLCRMQLLSGVHFQTCSCVSLWGSRTARTRNRRHGAVPPRIFTPCWRACPPTIECWKVARTNICDEVHTSGRRFVVCSCRPVCVCGSVLAYRCDGRN